MKRIIRIILSLFGGNGARVSDAIELEEYRLANEEFGTLNIHLPNGSIDHDAVEALRKEIL